MDEIALRHHPRIAASWGIETVAGPTLRRTDEQVAPQSQLAECGHLYRARARFRELPAGRAYHRKPLRLRPTSQRHSHPVTGFLSEDPEFATPPPPEQCEECNIKFTRPPTPAVPPPHGGSISARGHTPLQTVPPSVGVPTVPGSPGRVIESAEEAVYVAQQIGVSVFSLRLLPRGVVGSMCRVAHTNAIMSFQKNSGRTAQTTKLAKGLLRQRSGLTSRNTSKSPGTLKFRFGRRTRPTAFTLARRDCSVQRRHQKVIERSPLPFRHPRLRARHGRGRPQGRRRLRLLDAGTIEFSSIRTATSTSIEQ